MLDEMYPPWTKEALIRIRDTGAIDMLDREAVANLALSMGYQRVYRWLLGNASSYRMVLESTFSGGTQ